jgi:maltose alpha-D-glucosyltransferase / alpha-amylase
VLNTGTRDFQIIDFEGEPDRSLGERRIKRSPLRDVGGMLRSFDYAARTALRELPEKGLVLTPQDPRATALARAGSQWAEAEYLAGYLEVPRVRELLPGDPAALRHLLDLFVLEKALYELRYEIGNRPEWVAPSRACAGPIPTYRARGGALDRGPDPPCPGPRDRRG